MDNLLFDPEELGSAVRLLGDVLASYDRSVATLPVFPDIDRTAIQRILEEPLPDEGRPLEELFTELEQVVIPNSTHVAHPRFLAYVLASPAGITPLAEAAAAALNQNCNLWTLSPAATAIEQRVISWFLQLFDLGDGGGIITSGGSMANLSAIAVARDTLQPGNARMDGLQGVENPLSCIRPRRPMIRSTRPSRCWGWV